MSQKRANTLPLVLILCLALLMIGATALFIWLKSSGDEDEPTMTVEGQKRVTPKEEGGTTAKQTTAEGRERERTTTTSNDGDRYREDSKGEKGTTVSTSDGTHSTDGRVTVNEATTELGTESNIGKNEPGDDRHQAHITAYGPTCKEWPAGWSDECTAEEGYIASPEKHGPNPEEMDKDMDPLDWLRPLEYSLNISLSSEDSQQQSFSMEMQLSLLVELIRETDILPLHCSTAVDIVEEVRIWSCSTEEFVCVHSKTRLPSSPSSSSSSHSSSSSSPSSSSSSPSSSSSSHSSSSSSPSSSSSSHSSSSASSSLLLLHLARPLPAASLLRVHFPLLRVSLSNPNDALFVHIPSRWERHRPWMIGSQFPLSRGVRTFFPSVDSPRARAVLRLCLTHTAQTTARSNSPLEFRLDHLPSASFATSCFRRSPALPPAQFAFLLFRNLRPVTSVSQPHIELFIGAHLNPKDYEWAIEESRRTIQRMGRMTATEYPLEKLTLMSSPLQTGNDAMGGLGLAHIRDSWMEYPKFVHTHELLVGQLIRQWTSNVLSLCDQCIQEGLGLYLEWMVGSEERVEEFERRFWEVRDRLMAGNAMAEDAQRCAERVAVVLHMLERSFGAQNITKFVAHLFRRHGWSSQCTSTAELSKLFLTNAAMPQAQHVFDSFLLPPSSPPQIPLVHIAVLPAQSLLRLSQFPTANASSPLAIPVEIVDDTFKNVRLVLNNSHLDVPFVVSAFAIAQPKSTFARFVYNAENYEKLAKCVGGQHQRQGCPAVSEAMLKSVWDDLCWALFNGRLGPMDGDERFPNGGASALPGGWPSLFRTLTARGAVGGDCACCMKSAEEALHGSCRWTWLDRCARVDMPKR